MKKRNGMPAFAGMTFVFVESFLSDFPVIPAKAGIPFGSFAFFSSPLKKKAEPRHGGFRAMKVPDFRHAPPPNLPREGGGTRSAHSIIRRIFTNRFIMRECGLR